MDRATNSDGAFHAPRRLLVRLEFGLGNRLMGLAAALVVSRFCQRRLTLIWSTGWRDCLAALGEVVDLSSLADYEVIDPKDHDQSWPDAQRVAPVNLRRLLQERETVELRAHDVFGRELLGPEAFTAALHEVMSRVKPSTSVHRMLGEAPAAPIGIHARLTDHLPSQICTPRWCYRWALQRIRQLAPGMPVLLCSDVASFAHQLARTRGVPTVLQPSLRLEAQVDRFSVRGVQLAMADLWQLSRCAMILASPASTFARAAEVLGGGRVYPLAALPRFTAAERRKLLWSVASRVRYDAEISRWRFAERTSLRRPRRLATCTASLLCAWLACSPAYQAVPLPGQRLRMARQLSDFFARHRASLHG